jgi:hypothetical protein
MREWSPALCCLIKKNDDEGVRPETVVIEGSDRRTVRLNSAVADASRAGRHYNGQIRQARIPSPTMMKAHSFAFQGTSYHPTIATKEF